MKGEVVSASEAGAMARARAAERVRLAAKPTERNRRGEACEANGPVDHWPGRTPQRRAQTRREAGMGQCYFFFGFQGMNALTRFL